MAKVWLVTRERHTEDNDSMIVLGIYENESDAIQRVNEEFIETELEFNNEWEDYGHEVDAENHFNGYAELHVRDTWDDCIIKAVPYELNKATFETI